MAAPVSHWLRLFDFSSETTERNSTKVDRSQDLNILYQVCVFWPISKQKWPSWLILQKGSTLYSGARDVALWASFIRLFLETVPFSRLLRHAGNTEDTFSTWPAGPHGDTKADFNREWIIINSPTMLTTGVLTGLYMKRILFIIQYFVWNTTHFLLINHPLIVIGIIYIEWLCVSFWLHSFCG